MVLTMDEARRIASNILGRQRLRDGGFWRSLVGAFSLSASASIECCLPLVNSTPGTPKQDTRFHS